MSESSPPLQPSATAPGLALDDLCRAMHDAYEAEAARSGWVTQEASRKPWDDVPEANKRAMRAGVMAVVALFGEAMVDSDSASSAPAEPVHGALARAEALAAGDPDWMNVRQWPLADEQDQ